MVSSPSPASFLRGDSAPRHIQGLEHEVDIQVAGEAAGDPLDHRLIDPGVIAAAGIASITVTGPLGQETFLGNGGRLSLDNGRVEYAAGETDDPVDAGAAALAGMQIVRRLAEHVPGARIFHQTGTTFGSNSRTLGNHGRVRIPAHIVHDPQLVPVINSSQATRTWAWSGRIGPEGFELSQRAPGMHPTRQAGQGDRASDGAKPMSTVVDYELRHPELSFNWGSVEERVMDVGFSRWKAYMEAAVRSLMCRLVERQDVLGKEHPLTGITLHNPAAVLQLASRDLTLRDKYRTLSDEYLTATQLQERTAQYMDFLRARIQLPDSEHAAVDELLHITDLLRQVDIPSGDVAAIRERVDFAPHLEYVLSGVTDIAELTSYNRKALQRSLEWTVSHPDGGAGKTHWQAAYARGEAPDPIGDELIAQHIEQGSETTRAKPRGEAIRRDDMEDRLTDVNWEYITIDGVTIGLDPYQTTLPGWVQSTPRFNRQLDN